MNVRLWTALLPVVLLSLPARSSAQRGPGTPWDSVGSILGSVATANAGTFRYGFPRSDLNVRLGDVTVAPAIALGTYAAFGVLGSDTVATGDIVVTARELAPVLRQLSRDGIEVTAVHNHLVGEAPDIMYVHFMGTGSAVELAGRIKRAIAQTGAPIPVRVVTPGPVTIDTAQIFRELGARGRASGAVAQLGFDLVPGEVTLHGRPLPKPLGVLSPINIQAISADRAVATGDFTVIGEKVDPVLDALARNGITATAVHSHMIGELPKLYFIHFWADAALPAVLTGLRTALEAAR